MSKTLLLISSRPDDAAFASHVAQAAGLTLRTVASPKEGAQIIASEGVAVTLADTGSELQYRALEDAIQETIGLFSDKINANAIHFLSGEQLENVKYLIQSPLFGHFVFRNYGDPAISGNHYGHIVKATLNDRAFGLNQLFKEGTKVQVIRILSSNQKQDAVEAVRSYLLAAKFKSRMATVIANSVDELLMNATFDAPVDELGRQLYVATPRNTVMKLEGKQAVEMMVAFDSCYVGITAVDHYGSLDKNKLLNHISKIYTEEEYKVKTSVAGAGIGLATVFRSGGSFFFVSESHSRTEVTVFFRRTDSFREFKDQFRFLCTQFYF